MKKECLSITYFDYTIILKIFIFLHLYVNQYVYDLKIGLNKSSILTYYC